MIDIHCHILPGVDDGSDSMEMSVAMARTAWDRGTRIITATPHFNRPDQDPDIGLRELLRAYEELKRRLREAGCPMKLTLGMELFASRGLEDILSERMLQPLNGSRYLLTEFDFRERLNEMDWALDRIRDAGFVPVVAHPERYEAIQRRPDTIDAWYLQGIVLQLNKDSILGRLGSGAFRCAWHTLHRGLAHVVASDAHTDRIRNPGLDHLRQVLKQELSEDYTAFLLEEAPLRILRNQDLEISMEDEE